MQEDVNDITDLNYMGLVVPKDGEVAIVADGCRTWAPAPPDLEPDARGDGEHWLPMNYEPVFSADNKLIDVVAWVDQDPAFWWCRTGRGIILGAAELARVNWTDLPCILVSTPAGHRFLRDSPRQLESIVILDWQTVNLGDLFGAYFGTIICASREIERRLQRRSAETGGGKLNAKVDDLL